MVNCGFCSIEGECGFAHLPHSIKKVKYSLPLGFYAIKVNYLESAIKYCSFKQEYFLTSFRAVYLRLSTLNFLAVATHQNDDDLIKSKR